MILAKKYLYKFTILIEKPIAVIFDEKKKNNKNVINFLFIHVEYKCICFHFLIIFFYLMDSLRISSVAYCKILNWARTRLSTGNSRTNDAIYLPKLSFESVWLFSIIDLSAK